MVWNGAFGPDGWSDKSPLLVFGPPPIGAVGLRDVPAHRVEPAQTVRGAYTCAGTRRTSRPSAVAWLILVLMIAEPLALAVVLILLT